MCGINNIIIIMYYLHLFTFVLLLTIIILFLFILYLYSAFIHYSPLYHAVFILVFNYNKINIIIINFVL